MPARYALHGLYLSGPTYKVGLLLSLLGERFDYVHVALREGAHKRADHIALNRYGQVPALVDRENGRTLCQSAAILEYLADRHGRFGGGSLDERLAAREWMFWDYDRLAPAVYRTRGYKRGFRQMTPETAEMHAKEGETALGVLDDWLAGRNWLVGEAATIADIDLYGVVAYAPEAGFALDALPDLAAWTRRVEALPGFGRPEDILPQETRAAA